jgi:REP element-mobilizing transposase RayT
MGMDEYKKSSHAVFDIKYHVIWTTKYRYKVLSGSIAVRTRELIRQGCEARGYFCATVGTVTEEIIRNYIVNQFNEDHKESFTIED